MLDWLYNKLFNTPNPNDIVRFIRTEYREDTEHLADEDCIKYYDYITHRGDKLNVS